MLKTIYQNDLVNMKSNIDLWLKIKKFRRLDSDYSKDKIDHPLVGKNIIYENKKYLVEYVVKNWYWGFYYSAILVRDGSHRSIPIENISCEEPIITIQIDQFSSCVEVL